jgi:hypothetical protein
MFRIVVGTSLRRREQFQPYVVWDVVIDRFALTDHLAVHLDHVRMPVGNGRMPEKTKGQPLDVLWAFIKNIVVKAAFMCLAHALVIAVPRVIGVLTVKPFRVSISIANNVESKPTRSWRVP